MKNKWKLRYTLYLILAGFVFFIVRPSDWFVSAYNSTSLEAGDRGLAFTLESDDRVLVAGTPYVSLPMGSYRIAISYRMENGGAPFQIRAGEGKRADLVAGQLPVGQTHYEFDLNLQEAARRLQLKVDYQGPGSFELQQIEIASRQPICNDRYALVAGLLIALAIYEYLRFRESKNKPVFLSGRVYLGFLFLGLLVSYPSFQGYITVGNDIPYHLGRVDGIASGLLDGQFPVRIHTSSLYGFGYGSSLLYPELFFYVPALLRICNVSLVTAMCLFLFALNVFTAILTYVCVGRLTESRNIGIGASILYTTSIFRLGEMYTDGAIGQVLAMAFLPLFLYGFYQLFWGEKKKWMYSVIGFTCILQSHILSAVWCALLTVILAFVFIKHMIVEKRIQSCLKALGSILLLNLWFLLPLVSMMGEALDLEMLEYPFETFVIPASLLFRIFNPIGYSSPELGEALESVLPLSIGFSFVVCNVFFLLVWLWSWRNKKQSDRVFQIAKVCFGFGILFLILTTGLMPWAKIMKLPLIYDLLEFTQFPWRFLSFAQVFLCISGAYGVMKGLELWKKKWLAAMPLVILLCTPTVYYLSRSVQEQPFLFKNQVLASDCVAGGEYLYQETDTRWFRDKPEDFLPQDSCAVILPDFVKEGSHIQFAYTGINCPQERWVSTPLLYYPGYIAKLDGETLPLSRGENNVLAIGLPANRQGTVTVRYAGLLSWKFSFVLSFSFALYLLIRRFAAKRVK